MEEQKSVGEWNDYIINFLKAADVTNKEQIFIVVSAEEIKNREERTIRLNLETNQIKYVFDLNKTNTIFLKDSGVQHPKDVVGKKIFFKKIMVMNPQLKKEVEGLRIFKVE